jgi:hypothetical protein
MTALLRALYLWERAGLPKQQCNTPNEHYTRNSTQHRTPPPSP